MNTAKQILRVLLLATSPIWVIPAGLLFLCYITAEMLLEEAGWI